MSTPAGDGEAPGAGTPEAAAPFSADWKERILVPVVAAGEPPSPVPRFHFRLRWSQELVVAFIHFREISLIC